MEIPKKFSSNPKGRFRLEMMSTRVVIPPKTMAKRTDIYDRFNRISKYGLVKPYFS